MPLKVGLGPRLEVLLDPEIRSLTLSEGKVIKSVRRTLLEMKDVLFNERLEARTSDIACSVFLKLLCAPD